MSSVFFYEFRNYGFRKFVILSCSVVSIYREIKNIEKIGESLRHRPPPSLVLETRLRFSAILRDLLSVFARFRPFAGRFQAFSARVRRSQTFSDVLRQKAKLSSRRFVFNNFSIH
jgi:hypothetical protein